MSERRLERDYVGVNPVTGEVSIVLETPHDNPQKRLVAELHLTPDAAVVGEHMHPAVEEVFEVLEGRLGYRLDGVEGQIGAGERIEVAAGRWHDWWNVAESETVCRVTVTPGDRFISMIRTLWGLAGDGLTNAKGMPSFLQLIAIGDEFSDVIVFKRPPAPIARLVGSLFAPLARRRGYRGIYPRYEQAPSAGTPAEARAGEVRSPVFSEGEGPPGVR